MMTSHTSDKPEQKVPLIGAKGLGFRALLNWSTEPLITSGELEIGFSRRAAEDHAGKLAASSASMRKLMSRAGPAPVPVLAFPVAGSALDAVQEASVVMLRPRAMTLREAGYDTVVAAEFSSPRLRQRALQQLKEFQPQFLLFVGALDEIVLSFDGKVIRWSKESGKGDSHVLSIENEGVSSTQTWICRHATGILEGGHETSGSQKAYELAIAFRIDEPNAPGKLHCYFPTDVALPFPALFHASLELDSHRKSLNEDSEVNEAVLLKLADFYAECLEQLTGDRTIKDPVAFLTNSDAFPEALADFADAVYTESARRPLVPTINGKCVRATETSLGPNGYGQYLPRRLFGTLARCRHENERKTLTKLAVRDLPADAMLQTLRQSDLSIDERAAVVAGFAKFLPATHHDRSLLIDPTGQQLKKQNSCFPPPASGRPPALPRWARAKFLHPELWAGIVKALGASPRDRFRMLAGFGIQEFNTEGVITSLRRQAAETLKNNADPNKVKTELLQALFQLRQTVAKDSAFPQGRTEVRCRDGSWRDAHSVHLSAGYGPTGKVTSALYQLKPERLLGSPSDNGLAGVPEHLVDFFRWIGVNAWPATEERTAPRSSHADILSELPDIVEVHDETHRQELRKTDLNWYSTLKASQLWLVGLEEILATASSDAILAWLASDPRFDPHAGTRFWTTVEARTSARANFRPYKGTLSDPVRRAILGSAWLATSDGSRVSPRDSMITPGGLARLFQVPRRPLEAEDEGFGLNATLWHIGLLRAGVPNQLSDLSEVEVYRLLNSLKKRDVAPDLVRRLYAQVLELDTFDASRAPEAVRTFRDNGYVQVREKGAVAWAKATDALYLDRDNFPTAAREYFSLLDLPPRRSAVEVQARFGVSPISKQRFSVTVGRVIDDESVVAAALRSRLADCLPYIKVYRSAQSLETQRLRQLERVTLRVAVEADLEISLGADLFTGKLEAGQYLLDGDTLIVAVDPSQPGDELMLRGITAISDGLAELFELQSGDDFEKLLWADSPSLRVLQLRRLLSNQPPDEIERLLMSIDEVLSETENVGAIDAETFALGAGASQTPPSFPSPPTQPSPASSSGNADAPPRPSSAAPIVGLTATKLDVRDAAGRSGTRIDVRVATGNAAGGGHNRDPFAPTDAEQWAMMFESNEGRFPVQVSRLQGTKAFGCDCLSFASANDLENFRKDPTQLSLVLRFIEVKSGAVRLTENEVKAAEKHKKRYFIYRIQFDASARAVAHLTILSHPLAHRSAISRECEILVDRIGARERYRLVPSVNN